MFGDEVRTRRRELGFSQEDLAERAGIDVKTLRMIETGRRTPRPSTLHRLADALQLTGPDRVPFIAAGAPVRSGPAPAPPGPAQLPPDVYGFVGRTRELEVLAGITATAGTEPAAVVISALTGSAGTGKTALAVHWGHRVRTAFPDGQLYVDLRGFDPGGAVLSPAEAVRGFLGALAVAPENIPADLDAQVALYRSLLAGKRMVLVLDNALDSAQVRPLLPGANGCLVLVTSRNELTGLVAGHGARPLTLGLLSPAESHELLARRLGADRTDAEPAAVGEIVERCARLPLALTIVAARAAMRPQLPLGALAGQLHDSRARLDTLTTDDPANDVRAVFSWSYRALSEPAARLFRLLGLHPGPEMSVPAAAGLAGVDLVTAGPLLDELTGAGLLTEVAPGRFTFHDLLRVYAGEQAREQEPEPLRQAALVRLADHYLHTALAADRLLDPHRSSPLPPGEPAEGALVVPPADRQAALEWFIREQPVLVAMVGAAAGAGLDSRVWQLAWSLATYFFRRFQGPDWVTTQQAAMAAAERLGDERLQVRTHNDLAGGYLHLGRAADAERHLLHALKLFQALGDETAQAGSHLNLGKVLQHQGRHREALEHNLRGRDLFHRTGSQYGYGSALNAIGWCHAQLGDHARGIEFCEQALAVHQEIGRSAGESETWDSIAYCRHHLGDLSGAAQAYTRSAHLFGAHGDHHNQALCLVNLGAVHVDAGEPAQARQAWQAAVRILDELAHPDAAGVRARLAALPGG